VQVKGAATAREGLQQAGQGQVRIAGRGQQEEAVLFGEEEAGRDGVDP